LNGQFNDPAGIFVSSLGAILVADTRNDRIQQFTPQGDFVGYLVSTGSGPLSNPTDLEEDGAGNLVILDEGNHRIVRRRMPTYSFVDAWGWGVSDGSARYQICTSGCLNGLSGAGDGQFSSTTGVAVDKKRGLLYVSDLNNDRVNIFDTSGGFLGMWGSNGTAEERFSHAAGVAADASGHVYVADEQNHRVQKQLVGSLLGFVADSTIARPSILLAPPARTSPESDR
jgi:DNA-binding beta-propeller fold protein YncE